MSVLNLLVGPVVEFFKDRAEAKAKAKELDAALQTKKLEAMQQAENADIALSIAQINSAGWKDDWFTYVFSIPLIFAFVPWAVPYIKAGFAVLETMPVWYKAYLGSAVASAFGLHTVDRVWKWWNS